ncbi:DUF2381 family protein [Archangium violaceum]|uniref:DUF2381 family protein n=1 Tax=Archangium violaceum TaxID=83451 RepID=UPI002B2BC981|nr:DUF2381 family protein [Archangium gephyra]
MLLSILVLVLPQGAPLLQPPTAAACKELQRIELALTPATAAWEICVSPGIMTNFVFDAPVKVDLQDEMRFLEVTQGRSTLNLLPPPDLMIGERIRLTALLGGEANQQRVTFSLVAHPGLATHQVEVYRDQRPRDSLRQELAQEQATNQNLRDELGQTRHRLEQLQLRLAQSGGLRDLIATGTLSPFGIQSQILKKEEPTPQEQVITYKYGNGYRSDKTIAAEVWLVNSSSEPWTATTGTLVDAHGRELTGLKIRQDHPIAPNSRGSVIVEADARQSEGRGELTLSLRDESSRGITIPGLVFP